MPPLNTVLIADDLTGSLDSIAPFAALGMTCVTAVSLDALGAAIALAPQVLSVNLGTRELPPDQAQRRAALAAKALKEAAGPGTIWIKKIDSRLKGPIAAELQGLTQVLPFADVLLCPAIPELGRFVSLGHLRGHGVAGEMPVAGTVALGLPCAVPDATSDADLDRIAAELRPGTLVAAARGLSAALARRIGPARAPSPVQLALGPIGFAVGSRDPGNLAQVAQLRAEGGLAVISAPDGETPPWSAPGPFLLQATQGAGATGDLVSARLARGLIPGLTGLKTLLLTGGETAAAGPDAAGIGLLRGAGGVLPGLPLCHAIDRPDFPALITKSGGFGPPDTLLRLFLAAQSLERLP